MRLKKQICKLSKRENGAIAAGPTATRKTKTTRKSTGKKTAKRTTTRKAKPTKKTTKRTTKRK